MLENVVDLCSEQRQLGLVLGLAPNYSRIQGNTEILLEIAPNVQIRATLDAVERRLTTLEPIEKNASEKIKIGYSGHEVGFSASLMAAVYGARMIERHFSLSRDFNIHHIDAALIPSEFRKMTEMIDEIFL